MTPDEALAALAVLADDPSAQVPSPCISVCRMADTSRLCIGCFRTIDEIIEWGRLPEPGKRQIWKAIRRRAGIVEQSPGSLA